MGEVKEGNPFRRGSRLTDHAAATDNAELENLIMASTAEEKGKGTGRKANPALAKPVQPDEKLAAVVGANPMPRTEITKAVWDYIKKNGLQDKQNKQRINADEKLKALFDGRDQVTMFEMTKLISGHMR